MELALPLDRDRITIAILALGGEGGGVLADWIQRVASRNGYVTQGTSVPGVAQRTGSTVYYIEMVREGAGGANRPAPVLAMMPVPGDVDIVIASELMEAGRAILRGFVSADRTTLIGSTHRVYAISEKAALGDGIGAGARMLDAAERRARRFIGFDMADAAAASGSVISSVMFGALAASETLPFPRAAFEEAIRHGGKAVDSNLGGFDLGFTRARDGDPAAAAPAAPAAPTTEAGRALLARIEAELPAAAHPIAIEGVRRLMDY
ncbi:MAG: indolepyruvate oxidoreductase subunit beta family protein, partial [Sphingomonadales bacterium]|nr:indolepyruvate oxidoreductase subunit beta family protein [Sphingomonadales bacterium]